MKPIYGDLPPIVIPYELTWLFDGGADGDLGLRAIDYRDVSNHIALGIDWGAPRAYQTSAQEARENHRWAVMERYTNVLWALRRMPTGKQQIIRLLLEHHIWPGDTSRYPGLCGIASYLMDSSDSINGWRMANALSRDEAAKLRWIAHAFALDALNTYLVSRDPKKHKGKASRVPDDWEKRVAPMRKPRRAQAAKAPATLKRPKWIGERFVKRVRKQQKLSLKVA